MWYCLRSKGGRPRFVFPFLTILLIHLPVSLLDPTASPLFLFSTLYVSGPRFALWWVLCLPPVSDPLLVLVCPTPGLTTFSVPPVRVGTFIVVDLQ